MTKRHIVRHTVEIPDGVWAYAVEFTGGAARPQTLLREFLWEGMNAHRKRHTIVENSAAAMAFTPPSAVDPGAILPLKRAAMCAYVGCGTMIEVGEQAVLRTSSNGQREYLHTDHFRRSKDTTKPQDARWP